jgi:hypothetical protein
MQEQQSYFTEIDPTLVSAATASSGEASAATELWGLAPAIGDTSVLFDDPDIFASMISVSWRKVQSLRFTAHRLILVWSQKKSLHICTKKMAGFDICLVDL